MATPSEKYEIHCEKRYLEYVETPFYRAFRDKANPDSFDSNYAVLKRMEQAKQSLEEIERYYAECGVTPKLYSKPDSVTLEEGRAFFEAHGYAVYAFEEQRMMLLTHPSPALLVHKCPVRMLTGGPLTGAEAQLVRESDGEHGPVDHGLDSPAQASGTHRRCPTVMIHTTHQDTPPSPSSARASSSGP